MEKKQKFSIRKYKVGAVSVLIGAVFFVSQGPSVSATEVASTDESSSSAVTVTSQAQPVAPSFEAVESSSSVDSSVISTSSVLEVSEPSTVASSTSVSSVLEEASTASSSSISQPSSSSSSKASSSQAVPSSSQAVASSSKVVVSSSVAPSSSQPVASSAPVTQPAATTSSSQPVSSSVVKTPVEREVVKETPASEPVETVEKINVEAVIAAAKVAKSKAEQADVADKVAKVVDAVNTALESTKSVSESVTKANAAINDKAVPASIDTNVIIEVPTAWDNGYKGEGTIVAIIDSGIDPDHDILRLTNVANARYQSEEEMEAAKAAAGITYGKWYNEKLIFAYNYIEGNNNLKEADEDSHGMHVTGIAAANPSAVAPTGELVYGVAPEAQVMFMRVFSDSKSTTDTGYYVQAIKDAVKLGADAINLSLGSTTGMLVGEDESLDAAIAQARAAGVTVVIAGGNDGAFGNGASKPLASNPDYGLVGSPSTSRDALSVASFNGSTVASEILNVIGLENNADYNYGKVQFALPGAGDERFEVGRAYDYVYAGLGTEDDVASLDLTGKVALIQRGSITFSEKIANAIAKGAVGVIVYNNQAGSVTMSLDGTATSVPSVFIGQEIGALLAQNNYQIQFNGTFAKEANPVANQMSDFSSWGLTTDGFLKPDVTAPGGSIYSAYNNDKYGNMNGTSMAAPHVTGVVAIVRQALAEKYPDLTDQELGVLVKQIIMSTANPFYDEKSEAYVSPRQQGSGLVDAASAISTGLYVTGKDDYSSITLGNVGERFSFDVTVHNFSDTARDLKYVTNVGTDAVEDGFMTLKPRQLMEIAGETITVAAHSSTTVTITVDTSAFTQELSQLMENGYYLEGFVRFLDAVDGAHVVGLPFVGFHGDFVNLDVVETPIYDLVAEGENGFYYTNPGNDAVPGKENYTGLVSMGNHWIYSLEDYSDGELKTLGTFENADGEFILAYDEDGTVLAISPNGDGNQDSTAFKGVFLRNFSHLKASIYAGADLGFENVLWESAVEEGKKNYYAGNEKNPKSDVVYATEWSGLDKDGKELADGLYKYVVTYLPATPGAKTQSTVFDLIVDRLKPEITTATYDEATRNFTPRAAIDLGDSGIFRSLLFYIPEIDGDTRNISEDEKGNVIVDDNKKVFIEQNADGSYTLPEDIDLSRLHYTVEDYAGNFATALVSDLVTIGHDKGLVEVRDILKATGEELDSPYSFRVRDAQGNLIDDLENYGDPNDNILKLAFGDYTIELFLYNTDYLELAGPTTVAVHLDEKSSTAKADFFFNEITRAMVNVDLVGDVPSTVSVAVVNNNQVSTNLVASTYAETQYARLVAAGDYTIAVKLPEGYEIYEEDLTTTVSGDTTNNKVLTVINKTKLITATEEQADIGSQARYYNADSALTKAYDVVLAEVKTILDGRHTQAEVDAVLAKLQAAYDALNGQATDKTALTHQAAQAPSLTATDAKYLYASGPLKAAYDAALKAAELVLSDADATQAEVDAALEQLKTAQSALDGVAPVAPTPPPNVEPTGEPEPTEAPAPTPPPAEKPTEAPQPTEAPKPTEAPSQAPTPAPESKAPTSQPTQAPKTVLPTVAPRRLTHKASKFATTTKVAAASLPSQQNTLPKTGEEKSSSYLLLAMFSLLTAFGLKSKKDKSVK